MTILQDPLWLYAARLIVRNKEFVNETSAMQLLVNAKANPNSRIAFPFDAHPQVMPTPLWAALHYDRGSVVDLLKGGADPNIYSETDYRTGTNRPLLITINAIHE